MYLLHIALALIASLSVSSVSAAPTCKLAEPKNQVRDAHADEGYEDVVISAWYPGWKGNEWKPENIPWKKYTSMTFAFATTTTDVTALKLDDISLQTLPRFVELAKSNHVKAFISIGGWTGSQYFSSLVGTSDNRAKFVKTIVDFATKYNLDGVDFDWEYPNSASGLTCNQNSENDSTNFLALLQALKADPMGKKLSLTAAVGVKPFNGPDKQPMSDVSAFAKVFDHIAIMAYDVSGPWSSTVGPNAPLYDACAASPAGSAKSAVDAWTGAKFPANQLTLGIASYGHAFHVNSSSAYDASGKLLINAPFDSTPNGDKWDGGPGPDACGVQINRPGGIFNFWGLVDGGFLKDDGTAAAGIDYVYDSCSQTPFVYNKNSGVMVSYDDKQSLGEKGKFVNTNGLAGVTMWTVAGDHKDILIYSISQGMHVEPDCS